MTDPREQETRTKIIDLMAVLKKSLEDHWDEPHRFNMQLGIGPEPQCKCGRPRNHEIHP